MRIRAQIATVMLVAAACSAPGDTSTSTPEPPPPTTQLTGPGPLIISDPDLSGSSGSLPVAYLALPEGRIPPGTIARVRVWRTGELSSWTISNGGFDPVPVLAAAGDTITVLIDRSLPGVFDFSFTVPKAAAPSVVRSTPAPNSQDVTLRVQTRIVFSEPLDSSALSAGGIVMTSANVTVPGEFRFVDEKQMVVEFVPAAPLTSATQYELVVTAAVRDRGGMVLVAPATIRFRTVTLAAVGISVTTTDGDLAPGVIGYQISIDGTPRPIGLTEAFTVPDLEPGPHDLRLSGIDDGCVVTPSRARTVTLTRGDTTPVRFDVVCMPRTGAAIAFVRDRDIYLSTIDGLAPTRLTRSGNGSVSIHPAWAPDGKRLAFASNRSGQMDLYVMNSDGSNVVRRTTTGAISDPAWSPDGRQIAFTAPRPGGTGVYVVDADGPMATPMLITSGRYSTASQPTWAPDGTRLAYSDSWSGYWDGDVDVADLFEVNADGTGARAITVGRRLFVQPAWSPDGQFFAVIECQERIYQCNQSTVVVLRGDGTVGMVAAQTSGSSRLSWSPDGRAVAFVTQACDVCDPVIRFVRIDGSADGLLIANGDSPAWRP